MAVVDNINFPQWDMRWEVASFPFSEGGYLKLTGP